MEASSDLVLKKLGDCFPVSNDAIEARAILETYGAESWHREKWRLSLAALKMSEGNLEKLREAVEFAKKDYRDVLAAAEYPEELRMAEDPKDIAAIRARDRAQYEAWLNSDGK